MSDPTVTERSDSLYISAKLNPEDKSFDEVKKDNFARQRDTHWASALKNFVSQPQKT